MIEVDGRSGVIGFPVDRHCLSVGGSMVSLLLLLTVPCFASSSQDFVPGLRNQAHAVVETGTGFAAALPAVGVRAQFGQQVQVGSLKLHSRGVGRENLELLPHRAPKLGDCTLERGVDGGCLRRLEYGDDRMQEWWSTREDGLEQGWTFLEAPAGEGLLRMETEVEGAQVLEDAGGIWLAADDGRIWDIGELAAWDAAGMSLPIRLTVEGQTLVVEVDDDGARYPITVDPVYTTSSTTLSGKGANSYFGYSVAGAGDVNGDGYGDLIVGAYYDNAGQGAAYVYLGSSTGIGTNAATSLTGAARTDYYGYTVAGAGDVNGDGYDDVIVGAISANRGFGGAYLYAGSAAGIPTAATTSLTGPAAGSYFGTVAGVGDVNGDGYDDVAVGAYAALAGQGAVYIYQGAAAGIPTAASTTLAGAGAGPSYFGYRLDGAGDVNGDGYDDVVVASPYSASFGTVSIYEGSSAGVNTASSTTISGSSGNPYYGVVVAGAGDLNADGYDDVVLGSEYASNYVGAAYIFEGSSTGIASTASTTLNGSSNYGYFGGSVDGAGDLNGDGYADLVVGAYGAMGFAGEVLVYHGSSSGINTTEAATLSGSGVNSYFGGSVAGIGDISGDGYDDIAVGAWMASGTGEVEIFEGYPEDADGDGDAVDVDCDDTDPTLTANPTWFLDADGDGYGVASTTIQGGCSAPSGYVLDGNDCDDGDPAIHPDAQEICDAADTDEDCDGLTDDADLSVDPSSENTWYLDYDGDGYGAPRITTSACDAPNLYVSTNTDCDDLSASVHPGATEVCDNAGVDENCDGVVSAGTNWYTDADGDGYGNAGSVVSSCSQPRGTVADNTDCNDKDPAVNPGATEVCGGTDENCDGIQDNSTTTWYLDYDGDGYGGTRFTYVSCTAPTGYVATNDDCNDLDTAYHPGATETCTDTVDYNCDGSIGSVDRDGDGYIACNECNDNNAAVNPGAPETCNSIDDDCDSLVDAADPNAVGLSTWYTDADRDSYGDLNAPVNACRAPAGTVTNSSDCDDTNGAIYPNAAEICDTLDNNCDTLVDDADPTVSGTTDWYQDGDGDGFGYTLVGTTCFAPSGAVAISGDCDDSNADILPGATEVCDGVDNDCDALVDDQDPGLSNGSSWYLDADGDGYGDSATVTLACVAPASHVADSTDCNDARADINPAATEICDAANNDEDCDGKSDDSDRNVDLSTTTTWYLDFDSDGYGGTRFSLSTCDAPSGYVAINTDCDDGDAAYHPGAAESCTDPNDYNCDGSTGYSDADGDASPACEDCDDTSPAMAPGLPEVCDGLDNDCDTLTDEADPDIGGLTSWYADVDGDGFGDPATALERCSQGEGTVADGTDCNDQDSNIFPGATERCDGGVDNDCNGLADDQDPGILVASQSTWYQDADIDTYGGENAQLQRCEQPEGYLAEHGDCDDANADVSPGAIETCDGVDNDCDFLVDDSDTEVEGQVSWYADVDGDQYGDPLDVVTACEITADRVTDNTDCNDQDPLTYPGAAEVPNDGIDQNCDGEDLVDGGEDSDTENSQMDSEMKGGGGCGCATQPGGLSALWLLGLGAMVRRRRS